MKPRAADYDQIEHLYKQGLPVKEIAKIVGLNSGGAVSFIATQKLGLESRNDHHTKTSRDAAIVSAYEAGATSKELSEQYGFAPKYIAQIVREHRRKISVPHVTRKVQPVRKNVPRFSASPAAIAAALAKLQARGASA
jgi:DNA-binding CsgD family transcriptional regulator